MTVEVATRVSSLDATYPAAGDAKSEGDDHIRLVKTVLKTDVSIISASNSSTLLILNSVSTSLGNVSTSLGNVSTSEASTVTKLGNVSTSLANVSTSLTAISSIQSAVSSTVVTLTPTMTFVSSQTASASASITFTGFVAGYDYLIEADGVYPSANVGLRLRFQNSGVDDTGSVYAFQTERVQFAGSETLAGDASGTYVDLLPSALSTSSTKRAGFTLKIKNPAGTTNPRMASVDGSYANASDLNHTAAVKIRYLSTTAVDGVKIYVASDAITSGTFNLYKIARA